MTKHCLLFIIYASAIIPYTADAQENRHIDQKIPVKNKISVFVAGGSSIVPGDIKDSIFIRNGWNIEAGVYVPLIYSGAYNIGRPAGNKAHYFTAGIEASFNYAQYKADGGIASYNNAFRLQNGTINPSFEGESPAAGVFQMLAGPKATWALGKIAVSPSVLLGYLSFSRKGYILSGAVADPKQTTEYTNISLMTATGYSTSGFAVKPQITLDYYFNEKISVFASGAISFGPSVQNSITYRKPEGRGGENNTYSYDQFMSGVTKAATFSSRWQATSLNMGLRYTWIKHLFEKAQNRKQKAETPVKPGGAVSSSYAAGKTIPSNPAGSTPQGISTATDFNTTRSNRDNRISTDPNTGNTDNNTVQHSDSSMPNRLSMTPTTTRQTQGKTFGEKLSQGMAGNNPLYGGNGNSGVNPVYEPDKLAKSGGAVSSSYAAGKAVSSNPAGSTPQGISTATDFNTTRSNRDNRISTDPSTGNTDDNTVQHSDSSMPNRLSMTPTTTRQTQGKTFGEKLSQGMAGDNPLYEGKGNSGVNPVYEPDKLAMPGAPIGGVIIKGMDNPGLNNIAVQSDNNGEVLLNNLQAGNYRFQLSLPDQPEGKSINEKGIKRGDNAAMAKPGQPIGGIVVKGGKNPGGNYTKLTVNNDGQIGFEVLEPGNYKLIIEMPSAPGKAEKERTEKPKKKVVEKATSGLKDTLKTNV